MNEHKTCGRCEEWSSVALSPGLNALDGAQALILDVTKSQSNFRGEGGVAYQTRGSQTERRLDDKEVDRLDISP